MTLTNHHTHGSAVAPQVAWLAEDVSAIEPAQRERYEGYLGEILSSLGLDLDLPGTAETPRRFLQALVDATSGYHGDPKLVTVFPTECYGDASCDLAQIVEGPIPFFALCEHHALPFFGRAYVGYVAHEQIIGISKLTRLVRVLTRRFGVQERMTHQIAGSLSDLLSAHGVAVYLEADHLCTQMRGVREDHATTRTTAYRGVYERDPALRSEFYEISGIGRGQR
ncbi:MAG: GTP cyclohydrolase I FolE [Chloroflexota bacterium]